MTDLNRRHVLAGAAAAGAAGALKSFGASSAHAAVPAAGVQAPGFYRYKVGSFECTSINDGARSFPMPDKWVTNVPKEEALAAADAAYMPKGMVTVPFNPQLVNTGSKLVLIDCGNGVSALEQGGRPWHHRDRDAGSHARAYVVCDRFRQFENPASGGCHQHPRILPA